MIVFTTLALVRWVVLLAVRRWGTSVEATAMCKASLRFRSQGRGRVMGSSWRLRALAGAMVLAAGDGLQPADHASTS